MAKKITAIVKLQLPAGKATPGPPSVQLLVLTELIFPDLPRNSTKRLEIRTD